MGTTVTNIYNANATTKASAEDFWKKNIINVWHYRIVP